MVLYHDIFGNKELFVTVDNLVLLEPYMYLTKKNPINNININRLDEEQNKVSSSISKPVGVEKFSNSTRVEEFTSPKVTDDETIVKRAEQQSCSKRFPTILPKENVLQKVPIPNSDKKQHNKMPGIFPRKPDNLFWCIYIALYGYGEYHRIGHRYGNIEMEEKQKMVEMMKKSPATAKQCSKKITKALFQEIMSDFMTNKKMTMDMLTMVSIYHNKNFMIAHCTDSGEPEPYYIKITADQTLPAAKPPSELVVGFLRNPYQETSQHLLYKRSKSDYSIILDPEPSMLENISNTRFRFENHDMPLKAVSNYKTSELEDIFDILEIDREKDKKYKKEDYYHAIMRRCGFV